MLLAPGDHLAHYEILGSLGAGGMGEVYRARDAKLGRDVALKILPSELASSPEALRRFEQEARAASALNHPNIVTIYEIGKVDDMAWIAMELVDGFDLRTLAVREPLTMKDALRIAVKVADGLAAAHDRHIVHRDLKPDNVMVTPDGFVKILDFGLAKQARTITSDDTTIPHTSPGAIFGTVGYMSPEQATGKDIDYRSDQFSFGVMLYEMVTKVRPFERDSKTETMVALLRDHPPAASTINAEVPYDLDRLIAYCLAKHPRDRYASTRDLVRDLREIRDGITSSYGKLRTAPPSGGAARVRGLRNVRTSVISAAALVLALLAGGFVMWTRRADATAVRRITSVAVLPFRDLSSTTDGRVLADGMSELIASRLAEIRELRVSSPFDGARIDDAADVKAIAAKRGVHAVVRGSVQRGGKDVRVTYSLVDASTGRTLASRTATRAASDLFALQDEVAGDLVRALGRSSVPRTQTPAAMLGPQEQRQFVEAVGLLEHARDERAVDRAIASLESVLRNARESGAVNALLARALLYKAKLSHRRALLEQAMIYARRGVQLAANDPITHSTLGRILVASGQPAEAAAAFQFALQLRPDHPDAVGGLAEALQRQGRAADADRMYRKAIALQPDSAGTYSLYGAFCYETGRHAEAVEQFRKAVELAPDFALAYANLGGALQALRRYDEALAAFRKSLAIEPTPSGWSNLGTLQFGLQQYGDAQVSYRRAAELAPSDPMMWANLGDACLAGNDERCGAEAWPRAIATAREALAVNPSDAVTRAILGSSLAKHGSAGEAQEEIRRALEADPTNPIVLYQAAVAASLRGNADVAISWLDRAIRAGYPAAEAQRDPLLAPLRKLPAFSLAVKSAA